MIPNRELSIASCFAQMDTPANRTGDRNGSTGTVLVVYHSHAIRVAKHERIRHTTGRDGFMLVVPFAGNDPRGSLSKLPCILFPGFCGVFRKRSGDDRRKQFNRGLVRQGIFT